MAKNILIVDDSGLMLSRLKTNLTMAGFNVETAEDGVKALSKLKGGVRGKYARQFKDGATLVLLSPDVARYFPSDRAVNTALRSLVGIAKTQVRPQPR